MKVTPATHPQYFHDLSAAPSPPTGPEAEPYGREDGRPERFVAFLESEEGESFMVRASAAALRSLELEERRFSVLGYIHQYRAGYKVRINNSYAPWVADELVARHPDLLDIIERRRRKAVA